MSSIIKQIEPIIEDHVKDLGVVVIKVHEHGAEEPVPTKEPAEEPTKDAAEEPVPTKKEHIDYSSVSAVNEDIIVHNSKITSATFKMGGFTQKENQDAYYVNTGIVNDVAYTLMCGCDGHGIAGKLFANFTVTELPKIILKQIGSIIIEPTLLYGIFEDFNKCLVEKFIKNKIGGTTCTVIIKMDGLIITVNLGDFDAITHIDTLPSNIELFVDDVKQSVSSSFLTLTQDHSPSSITEVSKILDMGYRTMYDSGKYASIDAYEVVMNNDVKTIDRVSHTKQHGAYHMNVSRDFAMYFCDGPNKINMSRSFGDVNCVFVSHRPSITVARFPIETRTKIITGSDGYFTSFTIPQVHEQLLITPHKICSNGYDMIGTTFGYENADNTTIIILS